MRYSPSLRGFAAGVLVGLLAGSAGMASATFGLNGWSRFSEDFRNGYLNGFLDMANLARNLEPGGWVDERYPAFPMAKPQEWRGIIDKLYQDPANKDYLITSIIQLAAKTLEQRYGKPTDPAVRAKARMEAQLAAVRERKLRQAAKEGQKPAAEAAANAPESAKPAAAPPAAPAAKPVDPALQEKIAKIAVPPRTKKWCRCDGTDPQAAREKRRAEAAAAEAEDEAPAAKPAPAAPAPKPAPASK